MRQLFAGLRRRSSRSGASRGAGGQALALTAGLLLFASACQDRREAAASIDSALSRDLTLAGAATTGTPSATPNAAIGDTAVRAPTPRTPASPPSPQPRRASSSTPRPTASTGTEHITRQNTPTNTPPQTHNPPPTEPITQSAPAPAPSPAGTGDGSAASGRGSIGAGATLSGNTNAAICSQANRPGDRFVVSLTHAVTGANGAVLTAGTPILIELASAGTDGFTFRLRGVQVNGTFLPAEGGVTVGNATTSERSVGGGNDKGKVITGAIAGAILGRILGGSTKGAVIGAAGGAAAGTVMAQRDRTSERCMAAGASITVTLSTPLVLPAGAS